MEKGRIGWKWRPKPLSKQLLPSSGRIKQIYIAPAIEPECQITQLFSSHNLFMYEFDHVHFFQYG